MTKFLLDANLSPRIARHLVRELGLDVVAIQGSKLGELHDHAVLALAQQEARVIITIDRDFSTIRQPSGAPLVGIVYLNLPNRLRYVPAIIPILDRFFRRHAANIPLDRAFVSIGEHEIVIRHIEP